MASARRPRARGGTVPRPRRGRYAAGMRRRAALALICLPALPAAAFRLEEADAATRAALDACRAAATPQAEATPPPVLCRFCGCPAPPGRADHGEAPPAPR
jgi:hypothetical protein